MVPKYKNINTYGHLSHLSDTPSHQLSPLILFLMCCFLMSKHNEIRPMFNHCQIFKIQIDFSHCMNESVHFYVDHMIN